ncbi:MAG: D-alanyl-D-alanine carboxypeptidase family protein [Acetobacteraceae bacterium]
MQSEGGAPRPHGAQILAALLAALLLFSGMPPARAGIGFGDPSYIVIDAASGRVLTEFKPDAIRYPASLTKLMTLYLTFEALRDRRITLSTLIPFSSQAAAVEPVKLGLPPGSTITVQQAILSMVTMSANDAATALGQYLGGGSIARFAEMMTLRAHALGMSRTVFMNPSGLPDPRQVTTARDLAVLARRLILDFPDQYHWFSTRRFLFRGRWIRSDDSVLKVYPGADGIKTGYTNAAGHTLISSAERGNVRLIGVVMGTQTVAEIDGEMMALLNQGFADENAPTAAATTVAKAGPSRQRFAIALIPAAQAAATPLADPPPDVAEDWTIQVAAYTSEKMASYVAGLSGRILGIGHPEVQRAVSNGRILWRARITDLSAAESRSACVTLAHHKLPCWRLPPHPGGQVASR